MSEEPDFELVRGSGNVFRDFDDPDADLKHAKAVLAAHIIAALDGRQLTVRAASRQTGFAAADFSRIRNANLGRFTLDRLMRMLASLDDAKVGVKVGDERRGNDRRAIVIDKSYAQGESVASLRKLQDDWTLVFGDAFLFEVASTDARARQQCLSKLRQLNRTGNVNVGPNVGKLLSKEFSTLTPSGAPSDNLVIGIGLDDFLKADFGSLSRALQQAVDETSLDFRHDAMNLIKMAYLAKKCFPNAVGHDGASREAANAIATDQAFIRRFLGEFV